MAFASVIRRCIMPQVWNSILLCRPTSVGLMFAFSPPVFHCHSLYRFPFPFSNASIAPQCKPCKFETFVVELCCCFTDYNPKIQKFINPWEISFLLDCIMRCSIEMICRRFFSEYNDFDISFSKGPSLRPKVYRPNSLCYTTPLSQYAVNDQNMSAFRRALIVSK